MSKSGQQLATIEVEMPRSLRDGASAVLKRAGMTIPAAIRLFLHEAVRQQGMPFETEPHGATDLSAGVSGRE